MKIILEIDRAKPLIALALMCLVSSFGVIAVFSQTPEKILTQAETEAVLEDAARGALEAIGDEAVFDAVVERWEAREDLEGKTRSQLMRLLFADVQAVIQDPAIRTAIWKAWHPPTVTAAPASATTQASGQVPPVLDERAVYDLLGKLADSLILLGPSGSQTAAITKRWEAYMDDLKGKTRAQILPRLFADVQAIVTDPAIRTKIWKEWNAPPAQAGPVPIWSDASHPVPNAPTAYLTVVADGTMRLPLLKWDVIIVDEEKRPIAGAKVSMKLKYGYAGAGGELILSVNGRPVAEGVTQTATTNSAGACSFSIPWTQNVNYDLSVFTAQGQPLKFKFDGKAPYDGPLPKDFNWEAKWEPSRTIEVYSPEALANITKPASDQRKVNDQKIAQLLAIPEDSWTRADGWNEEMASAAVELNSTLKVDSLSQHQQVMVGLTLLKIGLSPRSYASLKKLYDTVRTLPRRTEPADVQYWGYTTYEEYTKGVGWQGQNIRRSIRIPFGKVPHPEDYKDCVSAQENGDPDECREILNAYAPYLMRWGRAIYTSCIDDPNLPAVADELRSLTRSGGLMSGPMNGNIWDPQASICSLLVKNEMAKDMQRDGFAVDLINAGLDAGPAEFRPPLTSVNIGGNIEKVTDQQSLIKWFLDRKKGSAPVQKERGEKRLPGETDGAFQARVIAMLRDGVEPVSGRSLENSLLVFRVDRLENSAPDTISVRTRSFTSGNQGRLIKNYLDDANFNEGKEDEGFFLGRVAPGKPKPDRREIGIAVYGWPVGVGAEITMDVNKDLKHYFVFVMKRWVMFNLRTGEIYGTSKVDGKLFP